MYLTLFDVTEQGGEGRVSDWLTAAGEGEKRK